MDDYEYKVSDDLVYREPTREQIEKVKRERPYLLEEKWIWDVKSEKEEKKDDFN